MMTQEEFMDVVALRRQGWTITDIAAAVGRHPDTVAKWLGAGGPPAGRRVAETVIDQRWAGRIEELLGRNHNLLASSVYRLLVAEGFPASYPTLVRHLRGVRGPRRGRTTSATVPIETAPGEEAQADWSDCCDWGERFGLGPLHCFGAILCWSRHRFWWFAHSVDRAHSLEGLVRLFEDAGGVPGRVRIDNMGALVARAHPRLVLHPPAREFAAAHGFCFAGCWPGDAARKGKVERPFRELKEALLEELVLDPPGSVAELNWWLRDSMQSPGSKSICRSLAIARVRSRGFWLRTQTYRTWAWSWGMPSAMAASMAAWAWKTWTRSTTR
jgi:transposase